MSKGHLKVFGGESCLLTSRLLVSVIFSLFESNLSNCFIWVVTPLESSDLYPSPAGVPRGGGDIWYSIYIFTSSHCGETSFDCGIRR